MSTMPMMPSMPQGAEAPLLLVEQVHKAYGEHAVLVGLDLQVRPHEVVALIGASGSGKSTLLRCINGLEEVDAGHIVLDGDLEVTPPGADLDLVRRRVGIVFQGYNLFPHLSVLDNIMTGRNLRMKSNLLLQALRIGPAEREEMQHRERVERIIDFLEIQAHRKTPVGQLPYGLQKRVDLGRALALEPQVLLLDEPMAGMNVEEKQDMCRFILDVNDEFGTTIVLIEHDMGVVMDISDRVVVLDYGKKIGDGSPDEVRNNEEVISAYLGTSH